MNLNEIKKEIKEWIEAIFIDNIDMVAIGTYVLIIIVVLLALNTNSL